MRSIHSSQIDLIYFGAMLAKKGHVLMVAGLVFAMLGYAVSFLMMPQYRAEVVLIPSSSFNQSAGPFGAGVLGGLAGLAVPNDTATRLAQSLEILYSRTFAQGFILNEGILYELFAARWSIEAGKWKQRGVISRLRLLLEGVDADAIGLAPSPREVQERFAALVVVKPNPVNNMHVLMVTTEDPKNAADWANAIVSQLNNRVRELAVEEAEAMIYHLKQEMSGTVMAETRQALSGALERQFEHAAMAKSQMDYVFRVVDPAVPSSMPASPRRLVMAALSFLLGGLLMLIYLVSKDLSRTD